MVDRSLLYGGWLHAHEEDEPGKIVYRPDTQNLPPSRGRTGYHFHPDGRLTKIGSSPVDRTVMTEGHWEIDPETNRVTLSLPDEPEKTLGIIMQDKDRLVVKA